MSCQQKLAGQCRSWLELSEEINSNRLTLPSQKPVLQRREFPKFPSD